mmetsp:Transcript_7255/g.9192  ORF Transcript_7255/g.9192 Transcript_7255/m.9192 type:complete len:158 (-) Transcript_7255:82-555(-)|eukprot:CAMPEP_0204868462 /NCGR_PEP_ID=MMETSP1348-20121228/26654_1 /ASSEMBLY_ACC=CAM_ASM_000700 /TAXON_ID=215587 /ORGANISM="Aplanochytrium stocchinoi, Strain GSBS06" /LENGTH=157 /DNA_ID=CAMNT_0052021393 /DNA_START=31 /DNA_END=504 /DNA_ORIENTATION=+
MEKVTKAYLTAMSAIWMGYGSYCFFRPRVLEDFCGLKVGESHESTIPEIKAMYGGLQFAVGLQAFTTLLDGGKDLSSLLGTLRTFVFLFFGLGLSRAVAIIQQGKSQMPRVSLKVLTQGLEVLLPEFYNQNATWIFEIPGGILAYYLWKLEQNKISS